jgi:hypothetical protein
MLLALIYPFKVVSYALTRKYMYVKLWLQKIIINPHEKIMKKGQRTVKRPTRGSLSSQRFSIASKY